MNICTPGQQKILLLLHSFTLDSQIGCQPEPGCEEYSLLGQAVADLEHSLESILTDSIKVPKVDASFNESDIMTSSASSEFLCLIPFQIILSCSLLLASDM